METSSPMIEAGSNYNNSQQNHILIRELDLYLLPLISVIYLLAYLDRSNIANAKLGGLEHDTHLTPQEYRWTLSIFFIGYVIFEVPSNIILRRWRPSIWIALIVLLTGTVAVSMAAVRNFSTLLLCRFLLGSFEAGLFPGIIYYTSLWYRRREQAIRLGFFWSFSALAGAFGGLFAYAIAQIKLPKLAEWQLIFIIEGIPTIIVAILCWFYLPDSPEQARFLTDKQRQLEIDRLIEDAGASHHDSFSWSQVLSVFTDWKTYIYAMIYICGTVPLQSVTLFLPTLIRGMGQWTPILAQLMTIPPYLVAFIVILIISRSSDHFVERSYHLVFTNLLTICGLLLLMFVDQQRVYILYIGIILVTCGAYANVSVKIAWFNNNFASLTRRAVASALIVSFGTLGGVISGQIYRAKQKLRYFIGNTIALIFIVLQTILVIILRLMFLYINRQRSQMNTEQINQQIKRYGGNELVGDRHPEFRYAL
ncbi:unnamed protein product [Rotaria sp. Silwood1]|nr:unnamed protein product [Rotaria sp. Silwood1]CAF0746613.1 unnamed protein product [Rotaria sp. Silwood1]CAF0802953.1 unnamed protein product [Rotaria sp. Silwood1]CAF3347812.1 unnamed protein product [Rotaria sp. Silwood1]CAF4655410.1 unnamed protein product [Rotaria sp. Silwood1]